MVIKCLKKYYPLVIILLFSLTLFFSNHRTGAFLMGWDNLMPEFDILLNIKRSLIGVWASYRGLGFPNGMSDIANLPHAISIFILSLLFPKSDLRFVFIILAHLAGGLGFYFLSKRLTRNSKASLISTLFYMFNIGTIQIFFAPLEAFAFQFLSIPLGALLITKSLEKPSKKNLLSLFLGNIFFSPQYFIPTFFIVYLLLFFALLIFKLIENKNCKTILIVCLVFFASNAFWLIPYVRSGKNESKIIQNTRINEFASPEIYYRNKASGDLKSVFTFKGFLLDSVEYDPLSGKNYNFMQVWQDHYDKTYYQILFFLLLILIFLGAFLTILKKKKTFYPYLLIYSLSFTFLANNTFPFDKLNDAIRTFSPSLGQAFRFSFTKFEILFVFSSSIFLGLGVNLFTEKIKQWKIPIIIFLGLIIILLAYPVFNNNFFSAHLKLKMPKYYSQMFDYLSSQDENKRIALLPLDTFWDWRYNNWGNFGSGFIWYGIPQPILTRASDPWSNYNEEFYNELSYATNRNDSNLFNNVLYKYDIEYLLLDGSFINSITRKPIDYNSLESFLRSNSLIKEEVRFGKLILYKIKLKNSSVYQLKTGKTLKIFPSFKNESQDTITQIIKSKNYVVDSNNPDVMPLFPSLYTGKLQKDIEFDVKDTDNEIVFISKNFNKPNKDYLLRVPSIFDNESIIPVEIQVTNNQIYLNPLYPKILINDREASINNEPIVLKPQIVTNPQKIILHNLEGQVIDVHKDKLFYIFNQTTNTIGLVNGANEELLSFDTSNISPSVFFINLPKEDLKSIKVIFPKINSPLSMANIIEKNNYQISEIPLSKGCCKIKEVNSSKKGVSVKVRYSQIDLSFYSPTLPHQGSYILFAKTSYFSGLPTSLYVDNPIQNRSEVETRLSTEKSDSAIILPKTEDYFRGYGFHFVIKSLGSEIAQSEINSLSIYPVQFSLLKGLAIVNPHIQSDTNNDGDKNPLSFKKINDSLYAVDQMPEDGSYVVLSQSFDFGWKAYEMANGKWQMTNWLNNVFPFLFGKELKEHVLVNNWANGWVLDSDKRQATSDKLVIIFWPQYLEYLGFGILIITFVWLSVGIRRKPKQQPFP